jgi:hypothetical protein
MDESEPGIGASVAKSRRRVLQTAAVLASMAVVGDRRTSLAGRGWCRSDPLVSIDGVLADIFCTGHLTTPLQVTGPTEIVVSVPVGVPTALVLAGIGFGRGELVRFEETNRLKQSDSAVAVEVAVYVPAMDDLEIGVEFAPHIIGILNSARAEGLANEWITLATELETDKLLGLLATDEKKHRARNGRSRPRHKGKRKRH